uniref:Light-independent protochlorophyllide reductase subunit B n=1 Tax=Toxarium undulatum TaxID=210620 RepID=A0A1D8D9E1_9STRA|nr:protochlorophyllide reductase subunit B [Toxarium undulatum]AOS86565.1 protochlorophyllide reductase subunit B [Toxarium undulatum]
MKLAYWMYSGPAHIGTLRIASSFKNVHAIMHGPLGDDYFNVMASMLERKRDFTPITTSVVDRNVLARGSQEKVVNNITRKDKEELPNLIILTPTCTSSILQEDLNNFCYRAALETKSDILLADVNHYRVTELQAADRTLEQIINFYLKKSNKLTQKKTVFPSVNIIGSFNLAFHNQHDISELKQLFSNLDIKINEIIPEGNSVKNLKNLTKAWFNFIPYREIGYSTGTFLKKKYNMPYIDITPIGIIEIAKCIKSIQQILNEMGHLINYDKFIDKQTRFISQSAWFSRSIDCQNLIGKRAVVFGDATHAIGITKILVQELGVDVIWCGTYCKSDKIWFINQLKTINLKIKPIITDDHNLIGNLIAEVTPEAIFGTQMERHVGKRLNIPCGVISAPVHIQNFPLSYRPFLGYEGANQISDLIYNSFTLGMEDHLLEIFGGHDTTNILTNSLSTNSSLEWTEETQKELQKIPGFVRSKIKRNIEKFAIEHNLKKITLEIMYAAKEANS